MAEHDRKWKMLRLLSFMKSVWESGVIDDIDICSMEFTDEIVPDQVEQLLSILEKQYRCIKHKSIPLCKTEEQIDFLVQGAIADGTLSPQELDINIHRTFLKQQRFFQIHIEKNFQDVYEQIARDYDYVFKLSIRERPTPVLFINDVPIRKFKNEESYPYKMMKLALGLPNGSTVQVKDLLKAKRGDRGCSQDLSEILPSATIKAVFANDITNASFKIFHTISKEDLEANSAFQKMVPEGMPDTIYLAKKVEECRIGL